MNSDAISAQARQFKRHATGFVARIEPHPDHAEQFRLTLPDARSGLGVIDVSKGGLGLRTGIYLAKNMRVTVFVSGVGGGGEGAGRTLAVRAVVRRCGLVDHKPTYQVGLQFLDPAGKDEQALIQAVAGEREASRPAVARAGVGGAA